MSRHAAATVVEIEVEVEDARVALRVRDDGRGFDPGAVARERGHLGLTGMAERARWPAASSTCARPRAAEPPSRCGSESSSSLGRRPNTIPAPDVAGVWGADHPGMDVSRDRSGRTLAKSVAGILIAVVVLDVLPRLVPLPDLDLPTLSLPDPPGGWRESTTSGAG